MKWSPGPKSMVGIEDLEGGQLEEKKQEEGNS